MGRVVAPFRYRVLTERVRVLKAYDFLQEKQMHVIQTGIAIDPAKLL
jgi:hypothetical protein